MSDSRANPNSPAGPECLAGKRVTVAGLGRFGGGIGSVRWLVGRGAHVTVSDKATAGELTESLAKIADLDVTLHLGGHLAEDFLETDLLVVNPAMAKELPILAGAIAAGVTCTTEINLFIQRCPCKIIGITGSVGKSTTTAMAGEILAKRFTTHVGGNIGKSLLGELETIQPDHVAILELSSFQLEDLPLIGMSPAIALITNLGPNHLDRHGTMAAYAAAKKNIFAFQSADDVLILNRNSAETAPWADDARGKVEFFDANDEPFKLAVPGAHNQANAQAAWAVAKQMGITRSEAAEALASFAGLPHRLQFVAEINGVRYFNDSKCTTPEGAIVAVEAFDKGKSIVIAGGYDKGVAFDTLGIALADRAKAVIAIGATSEQILAAIAAAGNSPEKSIAQSAADLASAVEAAADLAEPGDSVLLSPACASYDMYTNYEQRGDEFIHLVGELG